MNPAVALLLASYTVSYPNSGSPRVHVRLDMPGLPPGAQVLVVPRAIPMGYGEQPFDRFVSSVQAFDSGNESLPVPKGAATVRDRGATRDLRASHRRRHPRSAR